MTYIRLSYMIENNSPVHIGLKSPFISPNNQISGGDGYNTYIVQVENHSGTHIDAPGHFVDEGKTISEYGVNDLVFGNPLILDMPKKQKEIIKLEEISKLNLEGIDCLIFRTGFEKYREADIETYLKSNPGIAPDLIYWIRENYPEIRCIGIDCVSISRFGKPEQATEAHLNAFIEKKGLGEPLVLIEDMKLENVENELVESIIVIPWNVNGIDSAPCTVLAKIK